MPLEDRQTKPFLTTFERVRILGDRAKQISLGAKPMVSNVAGLDPKEIAKLELKHKTIPFFIVRHLPNKKDEKWSIEEFKNI